MKARRSLSRSGWDGTEGDRHQPHMTSLSRQHQSGLFAGKQGSQASLLLHTLKQEDRLSCVLSCLFKEVWTVTMSKINHFPPQKACLPPITKDSGSPSSGFPSCTHGRLPLAPRLPLKTGGPEGQQGHGTPWLLLQL